MTHGNYSFTHYVGLSETEYMLQLECYTHISSSAGDTAVVYATVSYLL